jgi:hypothetical protein
MEFNKLKQRYLNIDLLQHFTSHNAAMIMNIHMWKLMSFGKFKLGTMETEIFSSIQYASLN